MTTNLLFILILLGIVAGWWYLSQGYEIALYAARQHCNKLDVQFLDGTVSRVGYGVSRRGGGALQLVQKFDFEFATSGADRYRGHIELTANKVSQINLEPHRLD